MSAHGYTEDCIGYGVELSTRKANFRPRGRRPLTDVLPAILALIPAFNSHIGSGLPESQYRPQPHSWFCQNGADLPFD
jgi:hypothetical protein